MTEGIIEAIKHVQLGPASTAKLALEYRTLNCRLFHTKTTNKTTQFPEVKSLEYEWAGENDAVAMSLYATVNMGLLAQRSDIWGSYYQYPKCHFSGFYEITDAQGIKVITPINRPITEELYKPDIADVEKIFAIGRYHNSGTAHMFLVCIDVYPAILNMNGAESSVTTVILDVNKDVNNLKTFGEELLPVVLRELSHTFRGMPKRPEAGMNDPFVKEQHVIAKNMNTIELIAASLSSLANRLSLTRGAVKHDVVEKLLNDIGANGDTVKVFNRIVYIQKAVPVVPYDRDQRLSRLTPGYITQERIADMFVSNMKRSKATKSAPGAKKTGAGSVLIDSVDVSANGKEMYNIECDETSDSDIDDHLSSEVELIITRGFGLAEEDSCSEELL